ncbi:MAG: hypothetical protein ACQR33_06700 [Candidatus Saccharibacteria bacterium]
MEKKTILFAPGRNEGLTSRPYGDVLNALEDIGYTARFVDIDWTVKAPTADGVARQLEAAYEEYPDTSQVILGGFSFGAVAALLVAARQVEDRQPTGLVLASLSPFFQEDLASTSFTNELLAAGYSARQLEGYKQMVFAEIAKHISCNVQLFVGYDERAELAFRSEEAERILPHAQLTTVLDVGHDVADPLYVATMQAHLSTVVF